MKNLNMKNFAAILLAFLMLASFVSCETIDDTPPEIPALSTFSMDFSDFSSNSKDFSLTSGNWAYSAINVGIWNTLITVGLAVPVASYVEAFNHEAVYDTDEQYFTWSYNFNVWIVPYEAVLTGFVRGDSAFWNMDIKAVSENVGFSWYHGASHLNGSGGYWILNENPQIVAPLLKIDWERNDQDEVGSIKYTNIQPDGRENGGYIHYGLVDGDLDAFYSIYNKGENALVNIEWSREFKNGRVMSPVYFSDEVWHCWDTQLLDVDCE